MARHVRSRNLRVRISRRPRRFAQWLGWKACSAYLVSGTRLVRPGSILPVYVSVNVQPDLWDEARASQWLLHRLRRADFEGENPRMPFPLPAALESAAARSAFGWLLLRLALAGLIAAHGWGRLIAGGVVPFGQWLEGLGLPFGFAIAASITAIEIIGTLLLALRRFVFPLTLVFALIYAVGIVLVHAPAGWFVVGLGRNGAEYSVLLIVCLLCVGLQDVRGKGQEMCAGAEREQR